MSAEKKIERMPEELFLEEAFKNGRAIKTLLSMKAIGEPDMRFQARVGVLDKDHVMRLERMLEELGRDGNLWPIVVFTDGARKRYLIADGFHRHAAYRHAGRGGIPAYQILSDDPEREALEYCTSCNRLALKTRGKDDVRNAATMLLNSEIWWRRSNAFIAGHVGGTTPDLVARLRGQIALTKKISLPESVECRNGQQQPYEKANGVTSRRFQERGNLFRGTTLGQPILSSTLEEAEEISQEILDMAQEARSSITRSTLWRRLRRIGFSRPFPPGISPVNFPGIIGHYRKGMLVTGCDLSVLDDLPKAVASLISLRELRKSESLRMIILCYLEYSGRQHHVINVFRAVGFEFMTPDELIASLGAQA